MARISQRLIIAITLFVFTATTAQTDVKLKWTTDSEALPQNSVKSIAPDKHGYIWLTTENGLVRYDGHDFKVFNSQNAGLSNNRFVSIRGEYDTDSLYTFNDYQNDIVLICSREVQILSGTDRLNALPPSINRNQPFVSHGTPSILFDIKKRPYLIPVKSKSYYLIAGNRVSMFDKNDRLIFTRPFMYESNEYFFVLENTLYYMFPDGQYAAINKDRTYTSTLSADSDNSPIKLFWNIVAKQVFVYKNEGLYELTNNNNNNNNNSLSKTILIEGYNLGADDVTAIYNDKKNGIIFLGSLKNGLGSYRTDKFSIVASAPDSELDVFYALHPLNETEVVAASGIIMDKKKIVKDLKLRSDNYDIVVDSNRDIWVSKLADLYRYTATSGYTEYQKWFFPHGISTLYEGQDKSIWFSTSALNETFGTLYNFKPAVTPVFRKMCNTDAKITFIEQDNNNNMWIGTRNGLLRLKISQKELYKYKATTELNIRSIHISEQTNIWLTTYEKGFFLLQNNVLHTFPVDRNNYLLSSHCIIEDQFGYFWITTNKGLFKASKKNLLDYTVDNNIKPYYHYFNKDYGFLSNEFNGGCQPCSAQILDGHVFLPSIKGAVTFNPANMKTALPDASVFIDNILVNGQKIPVHDTIALNRNFERITFYFSSPYFGHRGNLNYEVSLEGPESQDWMPLPNHNNLSFTRLPPGNYVLTVRKITDFDGSFNYKSIQIEIKPAIWQTLWFKLASLLFFLFTIFLIFRLRTNYIRTRNLLLEFTVQEQTTDLKNTITTLRSTKENLNNQIDNNTKIIQYITHDIKSPLKFMTMASKFMYESFEENRDDLKENIKAIYTSSTQMYNFVSNLLEYSKIYLDEGESDYIQFNLHKLISEKVSLFSSIANSQRTVIKNMVNPDATLHKNRQLFSIIIHNLLDNATKYTNYGKIIISNFSVGDKMHIVISDTGKGMGEEMLAHYRSLMIDADKREKNKDRVGLHIVVELMLILNGKIKLESKENVGTTFTLVFDKS